MPKHNKNNNKSHLDAVVYEKERMFIVIIQIP